MSKHFHKNTIIPMSAPMVKIHLSILMSAPMPSSIHTPSLTAAQIAEHMSINVFLWTMDAHAALLNHYTWPYICQCTCPPWQAIRRYVRLWTCECTWLHQDDPVNFLEFLRRCSFMSLYIYIHTHVCSQVFYTHAHVFRRLYALVHTNVYTKTHTHPSHHGR